MSRQEYYESSANEIKTLYKIHLDFNRKENKLNDSEDDSVYTPDDFPWL